MICAAVWVLLAMLLGARIWRDPERVQQEARSPAALTAVAGTAVLGTGLTLLGWEWAGIVLLAVALRGVARLPASALPTLVRHAPRARAGARGLMRLI